MKRSESDGRGSAGLKLTISLHPFSLAYNFGCICQVWPSQLEETVLGHRTPPLDAVPTGSGLGAKEFSTRVGFGGFLLYFSELFSEIHKIKQKPKKPMPFGCQICLLPSCFGRTPDIFTLALAVADQTQTFPCSSDSSPPLRKILDIFKTSRVGDILA